MKINPLRTSAFRLAVGYGVIFTLGVALLLTAIYLLTKTVINNEIDAVITAELEGLTDEYRRSGLSGLADELTWRSDSWKSTGAVYLLVDPHLAKVGGNLGGWPPSFNGVPDEPWPTFPVQAHGPNDDPVFDPVRAKIVLLPDGYRLLVGMDVSQQDRFIGTIRKATLWDIGLTALVGVLAGTWLSRRLTHRVQGAAETCDAIVGGDLSRRLPVTGSRDEFDALAQAVNYMVDRLAEKTQILRATFDSAAHDLRAPLYRLRGRLEDTARNPHADARTRESVEASLRELEHVQRTLSTLLEIARAESAISVANSAPVDLAKLASDVGDLYEPAARARQLELSVRTGANCDVRGNRQLLAQVLANLVENSLKYVPAGGRIDLEVQRARQTVRLCVADSGPGIPEGERAHVLEPFVRLPSAASTAGTGLGLSLVAAIARLHHAQLSLEDNHPGLRVVLDFGAAEIEAPRRRRERASA